MITPEKQSIARSGKRIARVLLSNWMRRKIRNRAVPWPAHGFHSTTLIVAPHQDDEVLGCGGLIAQRRAAGENVIIAFITDGSGSHPNHPIVTPAQLALLRAEEAGMAAGILHVPKANLVFLNAPDGRLPHLSLPEREDLVQRLRLLIEKTDPAEIFITAAHDGSTEHAAANAFVREAIQKLNISAPRVFEYPVWSRWNPRFLPASIRKAHRIHHLKLTSAEAAIKQQAIDSYRSQIQPLTPGDMPVLSAEFLGFFHDQEEFFFQF